ncbi:MAG: tRNA adenosine(34) deaminase TadA [Candidatus Neomarinimicrobiota bacterium]|uniref:tRNA adenosine(34) deaminase TadA n=1 Tax=Acinetobacter sp. UBA6526 TaxID=1945950 RepID=UPI00257E04FE|nr:tRNA adenosine(34) deaminase TadA [Acinetobacter sp. UBA6526]MEC7981555.1 tRNA adenosine(34) deaminase TadA [Candidatus Neomarinimicrobiota bacterium]MEC8689866.1 tRNA adenosine(34) deaminase TadA [Candidatus Neomarinimicrobiota bacterium]
MNNQHTSWMRLALLQAQKAYESNEIPVGAIVVLDNKVIGRGYNQREMLNDPTAHAEIIAITAAANTIEDWRLNECVLYVTKEPCAMCAGAIINSRLKMVIFGCYDKEMGCCGSLYQLCGDSHLKNNTAVRGGIMEEECLSIIRDFFQIQRH